MEKIELSDKRKLELIELIMTNDYEKAIGKIGLLFLIANAI